MSRALSFEPPSWIRIAIVAIVLFSFTSCRVDTVEPPLEKTADTGSEPPDLEAPGAVEQAVPRPPIDSPDSAAPVHIRVGAKRVSGAPRDEPFVEYHPLDGFELPLLAERTKKESLGFLVSPFAERRAATGPSSFNIPDAGELLATALEEQLRHMKWSVWRVARSKGEDRETGSDPAVPMPVGPDTDPLRARSLEELSIEASTLLAFLAALGGEVALWVEHERVEGAYETRARIEVRLDVNTARIAELESEAGRLPAEVFKRVHTAEYEESAAVRGEDLAGSDARARTAVARVLEAIVRKALSDPEFDRRLAAYVSS